MIKELGKSESSYHLLSLVEHLQVLAEEHAFEKWSNFPKERAHLIDLLEKHDPNNTILISGDRHIAEISRMPLDMTQSQLYDITSSGLTHAYLKNSSKKEPNKELDAKTCDAAFLAMGRYAIEMVAQATRYMNKKLGDFDVLNEDKVQLYLESVLMQPSYKIWMFFDSPWWRDDIPSPAKYPAKLNSYFFNLSTF